jgi:uncharacterized metal-binding protein
MDGKIKQCICITFCVKLDKSATETLEMLSEAFGEYSLSQTVVFEWHSCFKAGRVSVEDAEYSGDQALAKRRKMLKKFENSSMKTVVK